MDRQTDREKSEWMYGPTQNESQTVKLDRTDKQTDRQIDRRTDKKEIENEKRKDRNIKRKEEGRR